MQTTISINGIETTITLTPEQVTQVTEASKPKLFDYPEDKVYVIGDYNVSHCSYSKDRTIKKYGRYRRTQKQAEMDFKRQTRMMRLSALAWEVGECKEFVCGEADWYVYFYDSKFRTDWDRNCKVQEKVYMTEATAIKVCNILNSGEYSLDLD